MDRNKKFVITISREAGSGGRTVGRKLAEKLGVAFCDKQVLQGLTEEFHLDKASIEAVKGKKKNWLDDFSKWFLPTPPPGMFIPLTPEPVHALRSEEVFAHESDIILGLAEERSCVIAGRFCFHVLKDHPNKVNVFIRAPRDYRIDRIVKKQGLSPEEAAALIDKIDESRSNYLKRIAGVDRYDSRNYDLVSNMATLTEEQAVQCILDYIG